VWWIDAGAGSINIIMQRQTMRRDTENSHYQLPTAARSRILLVSTLFTVQQTSIVAFSYHTVSRIGMASSPALMKRGTALHMGLYDEDIDWDADLFGKLSNKRQNNTPSPSINNSSADDKTNLSADSTYEGEWDMGQSNKSTMQTMRDKMKRQMGETNNNDGKPDVGWVPNYGKIVDEDEPWFTG